MEKAFELLGHKKDNSGIVYLSRVPPFMKVEKVRHLFSKFGNLKRVFLEPFQEKQSKRKANYKQGWIEFEEVEDAKECAINLNNNSVGGRGFHSDDLWNVKYLPKFKWHHLQLQLSRNRAIRQSKLRLLKSKVNKEHEFYAKQIKTSEKVSAIEERLEKKGVSVNKAKKSFKQRKVVEDDISENADENVNDLLDDLFQ
eukprot:NODE_39_length_35218_cov_0.479655.p28 type:complete len:198 gc:universal NODE_39_length_35218_cov_0.479655:28651-29244(+)